MESPIDTPGFKTRTEIASELNISRKTLDRLVKRLEIQLPRTILLAPKDYLPIYEAVHKS